MSGYNRKSLQIYFDYLARNHDTVKDPKAYNDRADELRRKALEADRREGLAARFVAAFITSDFAGDKAAVLRAALELTDQFIEMLDDERPSRTLTVDLVMPEHATLRVLPDGRLVDDEGRPFDVGDVCFGILLTQANIDHIRAMCPLPRVAGA